MNILVLSDTHGRLQAAQEMYERLCAGIIIDHIIHCGDYARDAEALARRYKIPFTAVRGNCDGCTRREWKTVETPAGNILVIHGHTEHVGQTLSGAAKLARAENCIAVCFGHTHVPVNETVDGIRMINPGSLTFPRDGTEGSAALIVATEKALTAQILWYGAAPGPADGRSARGGFLRRILNYSDGQ